jgi:hypothetical protein
MVFYEFIGDRYDVIAPHSETYIFTETFLKSLFAKYTKIIIIYDFDLAGTGANKLRKRYPTSFWLSLSQPKE